MERRWRILAALTFARAAMGFQFQSIAAVSPFLTTDLGLDKTQLGWLIGVYLLPGVVVALPGGLLGARFGDKRLTLFGLGLMAAGGLWLAFAQTFAEAHAARLISGTGAVILNVLLTKMVADWFEQRERVLAMSVLINAWPIGIAIALLVCGSVAEAANRQWALALTAVFAAAGLLMVAAIYRPPDATAQPTTTATRLSALTRSEWRLLSVASVPWLLYNVAYQIAVSFLPLFFLESGSSVTRSGAITALNTVLFIVSVQAGGFVLRKSVRPDLVCHLAIAGWCTTLLLLAGGSLPLLWIVLGGLLGGLPASAYVSLPSEALRPETRGAGLGVFYTIYYVGCALLPSVAGALYDWSGSAQSTLWMAAACGFACIPILMLFRSEARRAVAYAGS